MQNWEALQKKISEMKKDEFIGIMEKSGVSYSVEELFGIDLPCKSRHCVKCNFECKECMRAFWEEKYQPPKKEKWIVHRTLKKQNREVYIGTKNADFTTHWLRVFDGNVPTTYEKEYSFKYDFRNAVMIRDELNKNRVGKQYLWVTSKVEE